MNFYYVSFSSGDSNCICFARTACLGIVISDPSTYDANGCLLECKSNPACHWFSFDDDNDHCLLMETCDTFDNTLTEFYTGSRECEESEDIPNRRILIIGGWSGSHLAYDEIIDIHSEGKTCLRPAEYPRGVDLAVGSFLDEAPLVCGGEEDGGSAISECYSYSFEGDSWTSRADLNEPRGRSVSTLLSNQTFLVLGGKGSDTTQSTSEALVDGQWLPGPNLPQNMSNHCAVQIDSKNLFIAGGVGSKFAYILETETGNWIRLDDMGVERNGPGCGLVNKKDVVIAGGFVSGSTDDLTSVEIFNLDEMSWRSGPFELPLPLSFPSSVQYGLTFVLVGGENSPTRYDHIYQFDKLTYGWIELSQRLSSPKTAPLSIPLPNSLDNLCQ